MLRHYKETFFVKPDLHITIKRLFLNQGLYKQEGLRIIQQQAIHKNWLTYVAPNDPLALPKVFSVLRYLTGPGDYYHDKNQAFCFMFEVLIQKRAQERKYFCLFYPYLDTIQVSAREKVRHKSAQQSRMREEGDILVMNEEIEYFYIFFGIYLKGFIAGSAFKPKPYLRGFDADLLLFGYLEDQYFLKRYETLELYHQDKAALLTKIQEETMWEADA